MTDFLSPQKGQRRHVTILFCDLVGSTAISEEIDPEELLDLFQQYRDLCSRPISFNGGKIMKFLGDGIMACFGFPAPLENSAQAAARAALEIVEKIKESAMGGGYAPLSVRIGLHSGEVVISDFESEERDFEANSIVGITPNVANRLQTEAQNDQVVISEYTRELLTDSFEVEFLGRRQLRGMSNPIKIYLLRTAPDSATQARRISFATDSVLVGRTSELNTLRELWNQTVEGNACVVRVFGDPGSGKTRLVAELKNEVATQCYLAFEAQCSPYHRNVFLYPFINLFRQMTGIPTVSSAKAIRQKIDAYLVKMGILSKDRVDLLMRFLGYGEIEGLSSEAAKERTLGLFSELLRTAAHDSPMVLEFSDAHWIDPTSLQFLDRLVREPIRGIMLVITNRIGFSATWEPSQETTMKLGPLSKEECGELVTALADGKTLPVEVTDSIFDVAAGIPLFVEQLTIAILQSNKLDDMGDYYDIGQGCVADMMPESLKDMLALRLDLLGNARKLAQMAAVIGPVFSVRLLRMIWENSSLDRESFYRYLNRLTLEQVFTPSPGNNEDEFAFRHILLQRAAYSSMLKSTRRKIHQDLVDYFRKHPEASDSIQPSLMVRHLTAGGNHEEAIPWRIKTVKAAVARSAHAECVALADEALGSLDACGDHALRAQYEMTLIACKISSLTALRGHGSNDVEDCLTRAGELADELGDANPVVFSVLYGMWGFNHIRGNLTTALILSRRLLRAAGRMKGKHWEVEGNMALGTTLYWRGELQKSKEHLQQAVQLYDPATYPNTLIMGQDGGVAALTYLTFVHCYLGEIDEAFACQEKALRLAEASNHPTTMAWALGGATMFHLGMGDIESTIRVGNRTIRFCQEQAQAFWLAVARMMVEWARTQKGETDEGTTIFEEAFEAFLGTGADLTMPVFLTMLADCKAKRGDFEAAFQHIDKAIEMAKANSALLLTPGVFIAKAGLLLRQGNPDCELVETLFRDALKMAEQQNSRLRVLQATAGLSKLYQAIGQEDKAREVMEPAMNWLSANAGGRMQNFAMQFFSALD